MQATAKSDRVYFTVRIFVGIEDSTEELVISKVMCAQVVWLEGGRLDFPLRSPDVGLRAGEGGGSEQGLQACVVPEDCARSGSLLPLPPAASILGTGLMRAGPVLFPSA